MLVLDLAAGPRWLDLPGGVRLRVRPFGTSLCMEVYTWLDAQADPDAPPEGQEVDDADQPDEGQAPARRNDGIAFAKAVARHAVIEWDGVGDADGNAVPVTPEGLDALLEHFPVYTAFQRLYVAPGMAVAAEGNDFAPSPNGTSATAQPTAATARSAARTARA